MQKFHNKFSSYCNSDGPQKRIFAHPTNSNASAQVSFTYSWEKKKSKKRKFCSVEESKNSLKRRRFNKLGCLARAVRQTFSFLKKFRWSEGTQNFCNSPCNSQRVHVPIGCSKRPFFSTGDVVTSWLSVTGDVPYILKLASGDNSVCRRLLSAGLSQSEKDQLTLLQLS